MPARRRKALAVLVFVAAGLGAAGATLHAEVQLKMQGGRVSLVAKDATLSQILAEWAKVGQTKIVNAERVPGGPISLQLTDLPEQQALDILFRTLSGYMAAPRPAGAVGLSRFDRIIVMPTIAPPPSAASRPVGGPSPPVFQQPSAPAIVRPPQVGQPAGPLQFAQPGASLQPLDDLQEDEDPQAPGTIPRAQGPLVVPPPTAPAAAPPTPSPYPNTPSVPAGVAVPGMIVAPVQQQPPGRPAQPGQTPQ